MVPCCGFHPWLSSSFSTRYRPFILRSRFIRLTLATSPFPGKWSWKEEDKQTKRLPFLFHGMVSDCPIYPKKWWSEPKVICSITTPICWRFAETKFGIQSELKKTLPPSITNLLLFIQWYLKLKNRVYLNVILKSYFVFSPVKFGERSLYFHHKKVVYPFSIANPQL